jgi:hypothetical protein
VGRAGVRSLPNGGKPQNFAQIAGDTMLETPPVSQMAQVISQAIAPEFILGAVSGFISVLVTRLNRIIDRCRTLAARGHNQESADAGGVDKFQLNARANLINHAILWAVASAFVTLLLMITAFVAAFLELPHERGIAALFILALLLFCAALINFGREVRIAIKEPNNFD